MNVGLYSGVSGMEMGQDYQDLVTQNLALQSTPGYRQVFPVFSTDVKAGSASNGSFLNGAPLHMSRVIDFSQGPLQPSGSPYHVAIEGESFFAVREADGTTSYTRNGEFSLSSEGELKTTDGATVLGDGGSTLQIDTSKSSNVSIGSDGTISVNGNHQGRLEFAHFDNPSVSLQSGEYGRFTPRNASDVQENLAVGDTVAGGYLEQGNGNPMEQMAHMIEAMRIYEANQKSIKASDDTESQLITSLGGNQQA